VRVTVTGGNGFIGRPAVEALVSLGATVRVASRSARGEASVHFDIADKSSWPNLLMPEPPQRLLHLAWDHLDNFNDPRHYLEELPRHAEFLLWCAAHGIADITIAGTCLEYGVKNGPLDEEVSAAPVTAYAIAKDSLRRMLEHAARTDRFVLKWARIFFVRGDDKEEKGVFEMIRKAGAAGKPSIDLTWGEQLRDYLPRAEIGRFLALFCLQNEIRGIVNCCSGEPVSIRKAVERYAQQWPDLKLDFGKVPYRGYEPMALWGDRRRMERVLDAAPMSSASVKER
jgi:nucleoside-diphosphate-sugar epimerase